MTAPALETQALGKRYGEQWALKDCSLRLPVGRVAALIGANGAGKSTLLNLAVGLDRPTTGKVWIGGTGVRHGDADVLPSVGFLAQDVPLYASFTAEELLRAGNAMNRRFDDSLAKRRWRELGIPLDRKVAHLSGGQRAQVALALALAKCPSLLLLDEPLAALDPLARREFLQTLMGAVAESGMTILLSSHLLAELERVCDWVVVLGRGRVQLTGDVDDLIASHWWVRAPSGSAGIAPWAVIAELGGRAALRLVRTPDPPAAADVTKPNLEEVVLAYLSHPEIVCTPATALEVVP